LRKRASGSAQLPLQFSQICQLGRDRAVGGGGGESACQLEQPSRVAQPAELHQRLGTTHARLDQVRREVGCPVGICQRVLGPLEHECRCGAIDEVGRVFGLQPHRL